MSYDESALNRQMGTKDPFIGTEKGTGFADRLNSLIEKNGIRKLCRETGISYGAMQKYLAGLSSPKLDNLILLARALGVSIEWLAIGEGKSLIEEGASESTAKRSFSEHAQEQETAGKLTSAWLAVLDSLDENEAQALLRVIHKKGVDGIVELATVNSLDMELLLLPTEEKERLMALHEAKKGASEDNQENELIRPTHKAG